MFALRAPAAVLLLFLATVLAACTGPAPPTIAPPGSGPIGEVRCEGELCADNETGIGGRIINDEAMPIVGADVLLVELELSLITDEAGSFAFKQVPAGTYNVLANKLGYESGGRRVDVVTGQIAELTITLPPVAIVEPYQLSYSHRGRVSCGLAGVSPCAVFLLTDLVGQPDPTGNAQAMTWNYDDTGYPDATVVEVVWQPTATATGASLTYGFFTSEDGLARSYIASGNQGSPIRAEATRDDLEKAYAEFQSDFNFILYPAEDGATFMQDFTIYRTDFYNGLPPEGYSFIPDN